MTTDKSRYEEDINNSNKQSLLGKIIEGSIKHRWLVLIVVVGKIFFRLPIFNS